MRRLVALATVLLALAGASCKGDDGDRPAGGSAGAVTGPGGAARGSESTGSWPMAGGDVGRSGETPAPGPESAAGILWSQAVAPQVVTEPVTAIVGGKPSILLGSGDDVLCLDAATGAVTWSYGAASLFNASPAVLAGAVWAPTLDGILLQLDVASGKFVREHEHDFRLEASPLVASGLLLFEETSGGQPPSRLHALDPATGADRWHADYPAGTGRPPSTDGTRVFVATSRGVRAFLVEDGSPAWAREIAAQARTTLPLVAGSRVIVGYGGYGPSTIDCLSAADGTVSWSQVLADRLAQAPTVAGDELLVPLMDGTLQRLGLADGSVRATVRLAGRADARPIASPRRIYYASGKIIAALDRSTWTEAWRAEVDGDVVALAVDGERLIAARLDGFVNALVAAGSGR